MKKTNKIAKRLLLILCVAGLVLTVIGAGIKLYFDHKREISELSSLYSQINLTVAPAIAKELWFMDEVAINSQLASLSNLSYIVNAQVLDLQGRFITKLGTENKSTKQRSWVFELKHKKEKLGQLVVTLGLDGLYKDLFLRFFSILLFQFVQILFLGMLVFAMFHVIMGRHLSKLAKYVKKLKIGDLERSLSLRGKKRNGDEIDELVDGLNSMRLSLKSTFEEVSYQKQILETQVKERTTELELANRNLSKINTELDDFTHTISHDLKEPLRMIDAFSKFACDNLVGSGNEETVSYLAKVRQKAVKMKDLIEDLLEVSRIDRTEASFVDIDSREVVDEALNRLEYAILEKKAEIVVQDNLPIIKCDRVRFVEIFANLISNAIKYSSVDRQPKIEIGVKVESEETVFYVRDNGIGIEKADIGAVFQMFKRINPSDSIEGTGAGMVIVKKLIEKHNGKIWIESEYGVGTTFFFTLKV